LIINLKKFFSYKIIEFLKVVGEIYQKNSNLVVQFNIFELSSIESFNLKKTNFITQQFIQSHQ